MKPRSLVILTLIVCTILAGATTPGLAGRTDKALVRFVVRSDADLVELETSGLPVYARLNTADGLVLLIGADPVEAEALGVRALDVSMLDPDISGKQYYVVYRMPGRQLPDLAGYGSALYEDETHAIMRMSPGDAERLAETGAELRAITLDAKPVRVFPEIQPAPAVITPDSLIQEVIDQVDSATVYQYTGDLSGEWAVTIGGSPYTIVTRHTNSGTPIEKATQYVGEHLEALGLSVEYHQWGGSTYPNVIGELAGRGSPDSIVIICGHIDDMPSGGVAPGADDNASGTAAVMIAADIMTQYDWHYTLRFALWTGEEQGLWGSYYYAQRSYGLGESIVGVLNLDMIAYNTIGSDLDIDLHADQSMSETMDLAQLFADVVDAYGFNLICEIVPNGTGASDHASFWDYGYTAILGIEDFGDFNPRYHTTGDLLEHVDMGYYVEFVRASVATFAHMAGVHADVSGIDDYADRGKALPVLTMLRPGYPNPARSASVITYDIARTSSVDLSVYDAQGRLVKTLSSGIHEPGRYEITWLGETRTGGRSAPGVYFYSLRTDRGTSQTQKVVLVK
jgi:hypothetical protein